jgi:hypothetical protein
MTLANKFMGVIIIGLVVIILFQKSCNKCPATIVSTKTDTIWRQSPADIIIDSIPYPVEVRVSGKPYAITIRDTIFVKAPPASFDTAEIAADYFKQRMYLDTLRKDSSYVVVDETVYQNKLFERTLAFHLAYPEIRSTSIIMPKNKVFAGIDLGGSNLPWINGGISFALLTKSDNLYSIRGGFTTQGSWYAGGSLYWKIHF